MLDHPTRQRWTRLAQGRSLAGALVCAGALLACARQSPDPANPARGPGALVGNEGPVFEGRYAAGSEALPGPAQRPPPSAQLLPACDADCRQHCEDAGLSHPVHRALCERLWGLGLEANEIDEVEACRRLYADTAGRFPEPTELSACLDAPWEDTVMQRLNSEEFVQLHQRRFADLFLYNHRAVNVERIFDLDDLVGKVHRGLVPWDQFAAVVSAHPAFVRRLDSGPDRVDALFSMFLGRPPSEPERSDLARTYAVWRNGYIDHAFLGRVPDAVIAFDCVGPKGQPDPGKAGLCTSTRWGDHPVIIAKDRREARVEDEPEGTMWSGYLRSQEWELLQTPGKIVASMPSFWEHAAEDVLSVYFGQPTGGGPYYEVATHIPKLRGELARYLLDHNADIRALHFAVATSVLYRQSARADESAPFPWTFGPLKQIDAQGWLASVAGPSRDAINPCDRRISFPDDFLRGEAANGWTKSLVRHSNWRVDEQDRVKMRHANLARNLGGCPTRESGPSFRAVSIVNTALQESFVRAVCMGDQGDAEPAFSSDWLLGEGVNASLPLTQDLAKRILAHQSRHLLGRAPRDEEWSLVEEPAADCVQRGCEAHEFAKPLCFALLTGAEALFY